METENGKNCCEMSEVRVPKTRMIDAKASILQLGCFVELVDDNPPKTNESCHYLLETN